MDLVVAIRCLGVLSLALVASCQWYFTSSPTQQQQQDAALDFDAFRAQRNIVFVTADQYDGNLGGVAGADAKCKAAAKSGNLPGEFIAVLGQTGVPPLSRLDSSRGWLSPSGREIADVKSDFIDGNLLNPVNEDENGRVFVGDEVNSLYWTGADPTGAPRMDCLGWTSNDGAVGGEINLAISAVGLSSGQRTCSDTARLLCASRGNNARVQATTHDGKYLFVSRAVFAVQPQSTAAAGAAADALCVQEAAAAMLPGTYVALITFSDRAAMERLNQGEVYRRTDGVRLGAWGAAFDTFVNRAADGKVVNVDVWSGTLANRNAENCSNWVNNGQRGVFGSAYLAGAPGIARFTANCDVARPVYCGQQ